MSSSPQVRSPADVPGGGSSSSSNAEASAQPQQQQLIAGDDDGGDGGDLMQLKSVVSFTSAAGDGAVEGYESGAASNRFRSNIEIVEKPRQMIVLMVTIAGASYLVRVLVCVWFTHDAGSPPPTLVIDCCVIAVLLTSAFRQEEKVQLFFENINITSFLVEPDGLRGRGAATAV